MTSLKSLRKLAGDLLQLARHLVEFQIRTLPIQQAIELPVQFTRGRTFADYGDDAMFRAAVEREFQIIGEAISQLAKLDLQIANAISEFRHIIAFRNILIHGYADVDNALVWDIIETKLPLLRQEIEALLNQE